MTEQLLMYFEREHREAPKFLKRLRVIGRVLPMALTSFQISLLKSHRVGSRESQARLK